MVQTKNHMFPWVVGAPVDPNDSNWWVTGEVPFETAIGAIETAEPVARMSSACAHDIMSPEQWRGGEGCAYIIDRFNGRAQGFLKWKDKFFHLIYNPIPSRQPSLTRLCDWLQDNS